LRFLTFLDFAATQTGPSPETFDRLLAPKPAFFRKRPGRAVFTVGPVILAACVLAVSSGCGQGPVVEGRGLEDWIDRLGAGEPDRRLKAARILAAEARRPIDSKIAVAPTVLEALTSALADEDAAVRATAAVALAWNGVEPEETLSVLRGSLVDRGAMAFRCQALSYLTDASLDTVEADKSLLRDLKKVEELAAASGDSLPDEDAPATASLSISGLINRLSQSPPEDQWTAALELGLRSSQAQATVRPLETALEHSDPAVRMAAAWALGRIGGQAVVVGSKLANLMRRDGEPSVRLAAAWALHRVDPLSRQTLSTYGRARETSDRGLKLAALVALGSLDLTTADGQTIGIPSLIASCDDKIWEMRQTALVALGRSGRAGPEVQDLMLMAFSDSKGFVVEAAAWAVSELNLATPRVCSKLVDTMGHELVAPRRGAVMALGRLVSQIQGPMPELTAALEGDRIAGLDASSESPRPARTLSSELGRHLAPRMANLLRDPARQVRGAAARALGALDWRSPETIAALTQAMADPTAHVRLEAALSVGRLAVGDENAMKKLRTVLDDPDQGVAGAAAAGLAWLDASDTRTISVLLKTCIDTAVPEQAPVLKLVPDQATTESLHEMLREGLDAWVEFKEPSEQQLLKETILAVAWLGEKGRPAGPALMRVLDDERQPESNRSLAALALANLYPKAAGNHPVPRATTSRRRYDAIQTASALALGWLGQAAQPTLPDLLRMIEDSEYSGPVRIAAAATVAGLENGRTEQSVSPLVAMLNDADVPMREAAARALGGLGRIASVAAPALQTAMEAKKDRALRGAAARALGAVSDDPATHVPLLTAMLQDADHRVRVAAAGGLGAFGPAARDAFPTLLAARQDRHPLVRQAIVDAITKIRGEEVPQQ